MEFGDDQQFRTICFDKRDVLALLLTLFAKMKQSIGSNILFWRSNLQIGCFWSILREIQA